MPGEARGMMEFVRAAADFPAAVFGLLLVLVLVYWGLIAVGVLDVMVDAVVAVPISLFIAIAWFADLAGTVLLQRGDLSGSLPATGVLAVAVLLSGLLTRLLMRPLRRVIAEEQVPTRQDFVGRMCVIRTGRVDLAFGQAEVRAADGSAAVIQVRQQRNRDDEVALKAGNAALIFDYDADGEFFWVMPYDAELDPHRPPR
jgi:hypothetical protein